MSRTVFRVTGIPLGATITDLEEALSADFTKDEQIKIDATISPSCYGDNTQTALVQFKPTPPSYLKGDISHPFENYQMEMLDTDINIDKDFYGLTQLYPTIPQTDITADIVAVTGLAGHAFGSWRGKGNLGRMWLRDFLSKDLPSCRTMTYGYNSALFGSVGVHEILDYNRAFLEELKKVRRSKEERARPIIFIGHSFGGIIIAQSLVRSKEIEEVENSIYMATCAAIFFGTPHRGFLVDDIVNAIDKQSSQERAKLVQSINTNSDLLLPELEKFVDLAAGLKIVSFYERMKSKRLVMGANGPSRTGEYVTSVGPDSALLNLGTGVEEQIPVDADHTMIVKFDKKGDLTYQSTLHYLKKFVEEGRGIVSKKFEPALLDASRGGDVETVRTLLKAGVSVMTKDANGATPLHLAALGGHQKVVKLLCMSGASDKAEDKNGNTPITYANMGGHLALEGFMQYKYYDRM